MSASAAEIYEEFYLPALFLEWTPRMADAARVAAGQRVLDVACGTAVLAWALVERVGPGGSVVGLDINEGMLAVARRKAPAIEWRQGAAAGRGPSTTSVQLTGHPVQGLLAACAT